MVGNNKERLTITLSKDASDLLTAFSHSLERTKSEIVEGLIYDFAKYLASKMKEKEKN